MSAGLSSDPARVCDIVSERVFAAPRERLFRAFSEPVQLARWWGPADFTNEFYEFDLRPGGRWRFAMHGPDGARYEQDREFVDVVAPERIVLDNPDPVHRFRMTMTFATHGEGTLLKWRMSFESASEFARVKDIIAAANEQNFDRLEVLLATLT